MNNEKPILNPELKELEILIGDWKVEVAFPSVPPRKAMGHASFEWLEEGAFMIIHMGAEDGGPPYSINVIGRDTSKETYTMLYLDDRGVSRIYQMTLNDKEWKQQRNAPGFSQRFEGKFNDEYNQIDAHWEKSTDGINWEHDFDLTYIKE